MHEHEATIRALLYARVSSPEQKRRRDASTDEPSLGEQFAAMEREATRRGWLIVERCEDTTTGATPIKDRAGGGIIYEKALADAFDVLVVYDNDRIGRDQDGVVAKVFRADLRQMRKQVFSVYQPMEPKPPVLYDPYADDSALWLESMSDTASSIYIRQFCRRRAFGMLKRIEDKKLMAGKLPIGYLAERHLLPSGRTVLGARYEDPVYGVIVRRIFDEYEAGYSAQQVAVSLNGDKLRTPAGNYWTAGTIHGIVANPVYYGAVAYLRHRSNGAPHPRRAGQRISRKQPEDSWLIVEDGQHPALITKEQWQRVQTVRRGRGQGSGRTFGESTLLSGLVECGKCGAPMNRSGSWSGGYWVCSHARRTGGLECDRKHVPVRWVENETVAYLEALVRDPMLSGQLAFIPQKPDPGQVKREIDRLKERFAELTRREDKVREAYEAGVDTLAEYAERRTEIVREREALAEQLAALSTEGQDELGADLDGSLPEMLANFASNLRKHPLQHQKAVLREVIDKVVVSQDRLHIRFRTDLVRPSECRRIIKMMRTFSEGLLPI